MPWTSFPTRFRVGPTGGEANAMRPLRGSTERGPSLTHGAAGQPTGTSDQARRESPLLIRRRRCRVAAATPHGATNRDSSQLNVEALRADTPGCSEVIHFNNAGCALPPLPVLESVRRHFDLEARIGGYEAERMEWYAVERPYRAIAELLNCEEDEIAVVQSATSAWQQVRKAPPGTGILRVRNFLFQLNGI